MIINTPTSLLITESVDLLEDYEDPELEQVADAPLSDKLYETEFPVLSKNTHPVQKWGPLQASRMSSRIAGDKRTIIEKAQQLKEVQNLEAPKNMVRKLPPSPISITPLLSL